MHKQFACMHMLDAFNSSDLDICYKAKDVFSYLLCNCCWRQQRDKEDPMQEHTLRTKLTEVFLLIILCHTVR